MKRVKTTELKIGSVICVHQEWAGCKIDCEIEAIVKISRPTKYAKNKQFYMICFKDKYTEGQTLTDIVLREDRQVNLVTVEDTVKGSEEYLKNAYNYTEVEIDELKSKSKGTVEEYLRELENEIGQNQAVAYDRINENRT